MPPLRRMLSLATLMSAAFLLHACDKAQVDAATHPEPASAEAAAGPSGDAVMLVYQEQEAGIEPYTTRIIVTPEYLRIDDGAPTPDFVLLDRLQRVIHSVNSGDGTVLTIPYAERPLDPPVPMDVAARELDLADAPRVGGHEPVHHRYRVNGEACLDVIAVPGLADDAAAAMGEYREVLASEHRRLLPMIPADQHQGCDLMRNVFQPSRAASNGIPLQQWDNSGYHRSLVDYEMDFSAAPELFRLPDGYRRMTLGGDGG